MEIPKKRLRMANKRRINKRIKRKKRRVRVFQSKGLLGVIIQWILLTGLGIENLIEDKNLQKAKFGVSVATLGTFSLFILSFFVEISQITGVKITTETVRLFMLPALLLILSGLLTLIAVTLSNKRFFTILSNILLMLGLSIFSVIIINLINQFSYSSFLVYPILFAGLCFLVIYWFLNVFFKK